MRSFVAGVMTGLVLALACVGVAAAPQPASVDAPLTPEAVEVVLHRFDRVPGSERGLADWIAFLHARHRDAVATLARERVYLEAMFTSPDEPSRLYRLTVTGAGGKSVEGSDLDVDRRHRTYMDATLAKGSHHWLVTRNVLATDFVVRAVAAEQRREER